MSAKVYITPAGARALREELDYLWRDKRPEVTQRVSDAAALGDRSENADYIYGKKQLREIDKRIRYLQKRIDALEVVDRIPDQQDKVFFGAWVELEDDDGNIQQLRIVGADEFDLKRGWISLDTPVAKGLLGKQEGAEVTISRPAGSVSLLIRAVQYTPFTEVPE